MDSIQFCTPHFTQNRKLACVQGIKDIHYQQPRLIDEDPYAHLRNAPFFSFDNFVYNDPFHHDPSHELYADEPKGYLLGEDPNNMKYDLFVPAMAVILGFVGISTLFMYMSQDTFMEEQTLQAAQTMEKRIDDVLSVKKARIEKLEEEILELTHR